MLFDRAPSTLPGSFARGLRPSLAAMIVQRIDGAEGGAFHANLRRALALEAITSRRYRPRGRLSPESCISRRAPSAEAASIRAGRLLAARERA